MIKNHWIKTALAASLLTASVAASAEPIKIGMTQPLTGAVAASGNYVANGAKLAVEQINANGGVLGQQIELILEDNKSNPREAVNSVEKLVLRDKVPVIIGAWSSTFTLAIMPKIEEYGVPLIVETSSSSKSTTEGNTWVFRISPTSEMEAIAFAKKLKTFDPPITQVDFLSVNNDWGLGAANEFQKIFADNGIKVNQIETVAPDATDLSAQLAAVKDSGSDTLIVTSGVEQLTLAIRQAAEQRLPHRIITTGGSFPEQLIANPGPKGYTSTHLLFFSPWTPEAAVNPAIAKSYMDGWKEKDYPFPGLTEGFRGYDAVLTAVEAIKIAGKAEPEAIKAALWETAVDGVNGDIAFIKAGPAGKESGQNVPNIYVVQLKDGVVSSAE
mgnify:FL=1